MTSSGQVWIRKCDILLETILIESERSGRSPDRLKRKENQVADNIHGSNIRNQCDNPDAILLSMQKKVRFALCDKHIVAITNTCHVSNKIN